jgi:hypothetical protein
MQRAEYTAIEEEMLPMWFAYVLYWATDCFLCIRLATV